MAAPISVDSVPFSTAHLASGGVTVPFDLAGWMRSRAPQVAGRWTEGLLEAGRGWDGVARPVLEPFARTIASMLPVMVIPGRVEILSLWTECASLFGSVAARRGRGAGEVIEEIQLLREVLLVMLFRDVAAVPASTLPLRELLLLNRALDLAVTRAGVGYTDFLFFSLVQGNGIPAPLEEADTGELRAQIDNLAREARRTMDHIGAAVARSGAGGSMIEGER